MKPNDRAQAIVDALSVDYRRQIVKFMLSKDQGLSFSQAARIAEVSFSRTRHHFGVLLKANLIQPRSWRPVRGARETFYVHTDDAIRHPMAKGMLDATVLWPALECWQPEEPLKFTNLLVR